MLGFVRAFGCSLAVLAFCFIGLGSARAQIPAEKQSVIAFDIQLSKIRAGETFKKLSGDELLENFQKEIRMDQVDLQSVDRLIGSAGHPKSMQDVMAMQGGGQNLPMDFFIRMYVTSAQEAAKVYDGMKGQSRVDNQGGVERLRPRGPSDPGNVSIRKIDDKTLEMATDLYSDQNTRNFRTPPLTAIWSGLPNAPVRVALDAETASEFIKDALQVLNQQIPPQAAMMFAPVESVAGAGIAFDLEAKQLVQVDITGKDEAGAQSLENTLNGLLAMAKAQGQRGVADAPTPEARKVLSAILQQMNFVRNGKNLQMSITRPDGFDDAMLTAIGKAREAAQAAQKANNLRQVALAMHNFASVYNKLPFAPLREQNKEFSWRVRVLPFIEQPQMYEAIDFTKPFDEAPNAKFADAMPEVYGDDTVGIYSIQSDNIPNGFRDITDGTSNTIAFIQGPPHKEWMGPNEMTIDQAITTVTTAKNDVWVAMYDGSVRRLPTTIDKDNLRAMLTHNGGEVVQNP